MRTPELLLPNTARLKGVLRDLMTRHGRDEAAALVLGDPSGTVLDTIRCWEKKSANKAHQVQQ